MGHNWGVSGECVPRPTLLAGPCSPVNIEKGFVSSAGIFHETSLYPISLPLKSRLHYRGEKTPMICSFNERILAGKNKEKPWEREIC
ncbi:hypothetical protein XELAEV_18028288mg [Xenopus laevis]|uniref:Uncharacterized protein n=1 Tax=Xenopus laevis TaxID=8355 RepID=A0A974HKV8_XENLA|nr:hypothetical protein XELAEV_18028288mg [Xenopus laevis]